MLEDCFTTGLTLINSELVFVLQQISLVDVVLPIQVKALYHVRCFSSMMQTKVFLMQILLIFGSCYNNIATFEIYDLKFTGYLI